MNKVKTKIFIHGLESSSQGVKGKYFKERFSDMIVPDFTGPLEQRMQKLRQVLEDKDDIVIVGSSYGGLMATLFAMEQGDKVKRLVLLAPAINYLYMAVKEPKGIDIPTWIYHGTRDDVIPLKDVRSVAEKIFTDLCFNVVDDDHYLHNVFAKIPWKKFLS